MGKQYGGMFANWYGKIGNVVGRIRQGRTIVAIYQPNVSNPRTDAQIAQRERFTLLAKPLAAMSGFLKYGFHNLDGYKTGNYYSAAIGYNMRIENIFTEVGNVTELALSKLSVSNGNVDNPYSPSCSADGTTLSLTWADNSGMGDALATDKLMVLVYNPTKNMCVYNTALAERAERNATLSLPSAWTADNVNVWIAMRRDEYIVSNSVHLATLPL